jgi:hemerythrin-like domain-containing protein
MPTPTEMLRAEHENILRAVAVAEGFGRLVDAGTPATADDCAALCDFITGYADRLHHGKEEELLFPALEQAGIPREQGPVGVMLEEHTLGRSHTADMLAAVEAMRGGASGAGEQFAAAAAAWSALLRDHIEKENEVLFHMADDVIAPAAMETLTAGFEALGAQVGEPAVSAWLASLDRLEGVVAGG